MTRSFGAFTRVFSLVVAPLLAALLLGACSKEPTWGAPTPIEPPTDRPGSHEPLMSTPTEWQQFVMQDTGERLPAWLRITYISPKPGSFIIGNAIPSNGCYEGAEGCPFNKVELCAEPGEILTYMNRPPLGGSYLSNEIGGRDYVYGIGHTRTGPDENGCYTYTKTKEVMGLVSASFVDFTDPSRCCAYLNVYLDGWFYRKGESYDTSRDRRAFVSFRVGYWTK